MIDSKKAMAGWAVFLLLVLSLNDDAWAVSHAQVTTGLSDACARPAAILWTLGAVIQHIRCHHPKITQARIEVEVKRAQLKRAHAPKQVSIDLSASAEFNRSGSGSRTSSGPTLSASHTLYDSGAQEATIAAASAELEAAQAVASDSEFQQVASGGKAFLDVLEAIASLEAVKANVLALRESLASVQARHSMGRATRVDVLQANGSLQQGIVQLLRAENEVEVLSITLGQLLGLPARTAVTVMPMREGWLERLVSLDSNNGLRETLDHRRVREARAKWIATREQARNAVATGRSTLKASATYRWQTRPLPSESRQNTGVALTWSLPLLDGGDNREAVKAATLEAEKQRSAAEEVLLDVEATAERSSIDLANARATAVAAELSFQAAREALEAEQGRYRAGAGTLKDWLDAQNSLFDADRDLVEAQYRIARAYIDLLTALDDPALFGLSFATEGAP